MADKEHSCQLEPYVSDVEATVFWAQWREEHGDGPALTVVLVVDDPASPPCEALEAARRIEDLGAGVRFERAGVHYLNFFGGAP